MGEHMGESTIDKEEFIRLQATVRSQNEVIAELKALHKMNGYYVSRNEFIAFRDRTQEDIKERVLQADFAPVRAVVYGLTGLLLTAMVIAMAALVLR
jgi:hypothetical protein